MSILETTREPTQGAGAAHTDLPWMTVDLNDRPVHFWPATDALFAEVVIGALNSLSAERVEPTMHSEGPGDHENRCPDDGIIILCAQQDGVLTLLERLRREECSRLLPIALAGAPDFEPEPETELADLLLPLRSLSVRNGLVELEEYLGRVSDLPEPAEVVAGERRELDFLRFLYTRDIEALPFELDADSPVAFRYRLAETLLGLSALDSFEMLEELRSLGFLKGRVEERVYLCPACNTSRILFREVCPRCRVPSLVTQTTIHHFRCAHVGSEETFLRQGQLICPKCYRQLLHIGVDYDKLEAEQFCERCHERWIEGQTEARCAACDTLSAPEQARILDLRIYEPTASLRSAAHSRLPPLTTAAQLMRASLDSLEPAVYTLMRNATCRVCKRYGRPASVMRIACTGLTKLREHVGRPEFYRAIRRLAAAVQEQLRDTDFVVVGEDNTIEILLTETDMNAATLMVNRLNDVLETVGDDGLRLRITMEPLIREVDDG